MAKSIITINRELDDQFLFDIMTTFVESYCTWGITYNVERAADLSVISFAIKDREHDEYPDEDGEEEFDPQRVDKYTIINGIQRLLGLGEVKPLLAPNSYSMPYLVRAVLEEDAGDVDTIVADDIVQAAILNEIRFS